MIDFLLVSLPAMALVATMALAGLAPGRRKVDVLLRWCFAAQAVAFAWLFITELGLATGLPALAERYPRALVFRAISTGGYMYAAIWFLVRWNR